MPILLIMFHIGFYTKNNYIVKEAENTASYFTSIFQDQSGDGSMIE